ncbi:MAG: efflux RND transporter periplasmic adaptor subunit [Kiritimatiellae bacterium]|nr:efflux RND transporter periplasmic adaptor subunit [Kiritimatiellia bacterium]
MKSKSSRSKVFVRVLFSVPLLLMWQGCGRKPRAVEVPPRPVMTEVVASRAGGRSRTFTGYTRGEVETPISFRVDGEIAELVVNAGDEVEAGDFLARIDTTDHELQVRRLEAQLSLTEVQVRQAQAEFDRVQALFEARNVSRSEYDRAVSARAAAEAQRETALQGLNFARRQVEHGTLKAPRAGTVIAVPANAYQAVRAGTPVVTLRTDRQMVLEVTVAETLAGDLEIGQLAEVRLEAFPGQTFEGEISEISGGLSGLSALPVRVRMVEAPEGLRSGQAGEATVFFTDEGHEGVTVPLSAVTGETGGRRFVWVVDPEEMIVHRRAVEVGGLAGDRLEIVEGLDIGERIVVRGANRLSDGQSVRLGAEVSP